MKEQGHSQSASLLAHESSTKSGAAFKLHSEFAPTGDQPQAIEKLVQGFKEGNQCQTLLGVTGSGKTFTMANVIQQFRSQPSFWHTIKPSQHSFTGSSRSSSRRTQSNILCPSPQGTLK